MLPAPNQPVHVLGRSSRRRRRRGAVLVYTIVAMTALVGICSLAVDVGHIQQVKSDMQDCSDAVARGYMEYYIAYSKNYANTNGPSLYSSSNNPVDGNSGIAPTVNVTWGYWDTSSSSFKTTSGTYTAVQVTVSRTKANNNAVSLTWGSVIGKPSCDLSVTSVAACIGASQTVGFNLAAASDPYLAGMPNGSTASTDDTTNNAPAYQVPSITVTPGSYITFTSVSGLTNYNNQTPNDGPAGESGFITSHTPAGGENGIADAKMPIDSLMGVFLGPSAPNLNTKPAYIDWTSAANANQTQYSNLLIQQPFYVGTGATTGGVTQKFVVPPGATRLFLATWDGYEWNNDTGSFTGSITVTPTVQIMQ